MNFSKMVMSKGVKDLLSKAHAPVPNRKYYIFEGDMQQMAKAVEAAQILGIKTGVVGGIPCVWSKDDFDKVVQFIVVNRVEGYWHYTK